jgi:drug/metabolite transporter (DMT)-like permease
MKILTTALFSVTLLRRTLSLSKWLSLVLLTLGVALVQLPVRPAVPAPLPVKQGSFFEKSFNVGRDYFFPRATAVLDPHDAGMNRTLGLVAVMLACLISGLAGVYFEKVLKGSTPSLWVRNVQLSFFSLFPAFFVGVLWKDGSQVMEKVHPSPPPGETVCNTRDFFMGIMRLCGLRLGFRLLGGLWSRYVLPTRITY